MASGNLFTKTAPRTKRLTPPFPVLLLAANGNPISTYRYPLATNGNPISTYGYPFISNVLIFLGTEKAFLINGNSNSSNEYPFINNVLIFLENEKAFLINGNPNLTNAYLFVIIKFTFLGNTNLLPINGNPNSIDFLHKYFIAPSRSPILGDALLKFPQIWGLGGQVLIRAGSLIKNIPKW